jgi:hypothetical protein
MLLNSGLITFWEPAICWQVQFALTVIISLMVADDHEVDHDICCWNSPAEKVI